MKSAATTVREYLAKLPADRRAALEAVREVILKNLDRDYEEGIQYGMIGYYVPHSVFPAGYHCDPKQPLPFIGLASQKNHLSLYFTAIYGQGDQEQKFRERWARTGKKLDMGKSCIRFKKAEDLALDVIGQTIKGLPAKKYIQTYLTALMATNPAAAMKAMKADSAPATRTARPRARAASAARR
jgi:uncharacterized protein YdhG (YjbR/CyaY superfamily)